MNIIIMALFVYSWLYISYRADHQSWENNWVISDLPCTKLEVPRECFDARSTSCEQTTVYEVSFLRASLYNVTDWNCQRVVFTYGINPTHWLAVFLLLRPLTGQRTRPRTPFIGPIPNNRRGLIWMPVYASEGTVHMVTVSKKVNSNEDETGP